MTGVVLDTHAAIWYLAGSPKLSERAATCIGEAVREGAPVCISAISLLEVVYLVEKGKMQEVALDRLLDALASPDADLVAVPFDAQKAVTARRLPRDDIPDMPDRIIAATALDLGFPLVTRDCKIRAAEIETVW